MNEKSKPITSEAAENSLASLRHLTRRLQSKVLVLAVDDDVADLNILIGLLRYYTNFDIYEATTAHKAINLINAMRFEVVFLDLAMPGQSGLDILREVGICTRFVVVTGLDAHAPDVMEALKLGAVSFITKPVTREKLEAIFN